MPYTHDENLFFNLIEDGFADYNVLIEGDSWVSHPLLANLGLQFENLGKGNFNILNLATPGDLAHRILDPGGRQLKKLSRLIQNEQFGYKFDLIFLSLGGNDITGSALKKTLDNKADYPDKYGRDLLNEKFKETLKGIKKDLKNLVKIRNNTAINKKTPIVIHVYSYLKPRQKGTKIFGHHFGKGWVDVYLERQGVTDPKEKQDISDGLLDGLHEVFKEIEQDASKFFVVDTRPVLSKNGKPDVSLWQDELHPTSAGFAKVGKKIRKKCKDAGVWPS
jgi:lysophospholipase L1-like esterase